MFSRFFGTEIIDVRMICAEIIDAHSGTIAAEPSNLGGVRIIIELNKAE